MLRFCALCVCFQALAEQQKAQQLAQQQTGAPQAQATPGQAQTPAAGQAQVPQAAAVAGAAAVPNAAVLVRISTTILLHTVRSKEKTIEPTEIFTHMFCVFFRLEP